MVAALTGTHAAVAGPLLCVSHAQLCAGLCLRHGIAGIILGSAGSRQASASTVRVKSCRPALAGRCVMFCHLQMQKQAGRPRQLLRPRRRRQLMPSRKQQGSRTPPPRQQRQQTARRRRRRRLSRLSQTSSRGLQFQQRQLQVNGLHQLKCSNTCRRGCR